MIHKILVPVDGSAHSKKALEFACELANRFDAKLALLHVVEHGPEERTMVLGSAHVTIPAKPEEIERAGRSVTDAAAHVAEGLGCAVSDAQVVSGPAARAILAAAEHGGVDTIVMGSRGLSDLAGLLMGSVSHKVAHLAGCSCIIVR